MKEIVLILDCMAINTFLFLIVLNIFTMKTYINH